MKKSFLCFAAVVATSLFCADAEVLKWTKEVDCPAGLKIEFVSPDEKINKETTENFYKILVKMFDEISLVNVSLKVFFLGGEKFISCMGEDPSKSFFKYRVMTWHYDDICREQLFFGEFADERMARDRYEDLSEEFCKNTYCATEIIENMKKEDGAEVKNESHGFWNFFKHR